MATGAAGECYYSFDGAELIIGNAIIERRWRADAGTLTATSFRDKRTGRDWCHSPAKVPVLAVARDVIAKANIGRVHHVVGRRSVVEEESLTVLVHVRSAGAGPQVEVVHHLAIFAGAAGVTMWAGVRGGDGPAGGQAAGSADATGVETAELKYGELPASDVADALELDPLHLQFTAVALVDQTDVHDTLVFTKRWLLHTNQWDIGERGNVFFFEHTLRTDGLIVIKHAPLPHARPVKCARDITVRGGSCVVQGHGLAPASNASGDEVTVLAYTGGRHGRIAALQRHQRNFRIYDPNRDGLLVSNTWGDRSKDGRVRESFLLQEIEAGGRLGVDVVQIDDGWQRGRTANSVEAGGVWNGFWAADAQFWAPHPERFPNGLAPVTEAVRQNGMKLGLWYAPDSSNDFANAQRDAQQILALYREHGATAIKIDGVKMHSKIGEANLRAMFESVLRESEGKVVFDLDVTAETRPGYFGMISPGPLFVENRYTDFHRYWPHHTLRNLWMLAHYVDPVRLRMEFLNNTRKDDVYGPGDPLRPSVYAPEYLFAVTMMAAPLAWCEVSNLPAAYIERVSKVVAVWKAHREAIHRGPIVPVGAEPDGTSWTGFVTGAAGGPRYVLAFRELNDRRTGTFEAPVVAGEQAELLAGSGRANCADGHVTVELPEPLSFCLVRVNQR